MDYWPHWTPVHVRIEHLDTAWVSLDPSGFPILRGIEVQGAEEIELSFILMNVTDTAHAFTYPIYYDTSALELQDYNVDTMTLPLSVVWTISERDTIENDSGKVFFYAYTTLYPYGIPPGIHRMGRAVFSGNYNIDTLFTMIDTCFYPPGGHLYYTDGVAPIDYFPKWIGVNVTSAPSICGDADDNGAVTSADGYFVLNFIGSGSEPASCWAANVNGDSEVTPSDGYRLLNYLGVGPELDCAPCEF